MESSTHTLDVLKKVSYVEGHADTTRNAVNILNGRFGGDGRIGDTSGRAHGRNQ